MLLLLIENLVFVFVLNLLFLLLQVLALTGVHVQQEATVIRQDYMTSHSVSLVLVASIALVNIKLITLVTVTQVCFTFFI